MSTERVEPGWTLEVDPEGDGERLDRFIARRLSRVSRNRAARLKVTDLNSPDRHLKKSTRVVRGQRLWIARPFPQEVCCSIAPEILFEDQDVIVINKPSGWATHPTASRFKTAITTWLSSQRIQAQPAHRLDVETSGVLLCVKTKGLESSIKSSFLNHEVKKTYWLVCEGEARGPKGEQSWLDERGLGFDSSSVVKMKMGRGELKAATHFKNLIYDRHTDRSLISAHPLSGRQHQLRVHLSLNGTPIVGDKLYGPSEEYFLRHLERELTREDWFILGHDRQALHAKEISVQIHGEERTWSAPYPQDLRDLISIPID